MPSMTETQRADYFEKAYKDQCKTTAFYKMELAKTQEILGRVIVQYSERWDKVQLTNYPRERPTQ